MMEYAIVDIETTGGYAADNAITEIAILIHDGKKVVNSYGTLINPMRPISLHIQALTGITDDMVADSPVFEQVAERIYKMLMGRIFVAHNVNFDYSFVKFHLAEVGYSFSAPKLCTVRLSRKIRPNLPSYSLGKLCDVLKIPLENRHRASGDAHATAILFSRLLEWDLEGHIAVMLKKTSKEQQLPPNLPKENMDPLPHCPGVYYFINKAGKVIYVGKAKDIRKRVSSHFTGHNPTSQRQHFLQNIYSISYETCGTELMAFLFEAVEIKRLWPIYNRALKRNKPSFGLYAYEGQNDYLRLSIGKNDKGRQAVYVANRQEEVIRILHQLIKDFNLCRDLCHFNLHLNYSHSLQYPKGASQKLLLDVPPSQEYNQRVKNAIYHLSNNLPSFAILDKGRREDEKSCIWVEKGSFYGMGYIDRYADIERVEEVKKVLTRYGSSRYIMQHIYAYAEKYPNKVIRFKNETEEYDRINDEYENSTG